MAERIEDLGENTFLLLKWNKRKTQRPWLRFYESCALVPPDWWHRGLVTSDVDVPGGNEAQCVRGQPGSASLAALADSFHLPWAFLPATLRDDSSNFENNPQSLGPTPEIL